jgi:hypothetical protein
MARSSGDYPTPEKIKKAIAVLETGGTKKAACDALGIRYNTTRLQKIIEDHTQRETIEKNLRDKKRGTAVDKDEAIGIIKHYFETASIDATSKRFFRPISAINKVLDHYGAKLYTNSTSPLKPGLLPDLCMVDFFREGEYVWSAAYNCLAQVIKLNPNPANCYQVWIMGSRARFDNAMVYDLGSLRHLEAMGLDFSRITFYERSRKEYDDE